jgi:hypothetical protein
MLGKYTYLSVLVFLMTDAGNAQLFRSIGTKVAYSSAFQDFDFASNISGGKRISVINFSAFAELFDGSPLAVMVQCEYVQRGMRDRFAIISPTGPEIIGYDDKDSRVRYLSFPILAKIYLLKGLLSPYLLAGGRIDFMLSYKSDDDAYSAVYNMFARSTYGLSGGGGMELVLSSELFMLFEARYNLDLKDSYRTQFLRVRNNSIDFWFGVAFVV